MKKNYLKRNFKYWQKGYYAPNIEPAVFRFYSQFIKKKIKKKINLLDFGCGKGLAVNFFNQHKINAYGVDISQKDISIAKKKYKKIKDKFFTKDFNELKINMQKKKIRYNHMYPVFVLSYSIMILNYTLIILTRY